MAGFRLAPVAARRRRNPWQRKRVPGRSYNSTPSGTIDDGFTITDGTYFPTAGWYRVTWTASYQRTVTDGFTIADSVVGANPSSGVASGGLFFLFSQGTAGSAYTRAASDGFTITDSASGSYAPVATNSFARTCTDGFTFSDAASGSVVVGGADATLVAVELDFTAVLDVELSFVGE